MRSAIDARGSTVAAAVALLAGIALIVGSLLHVERRASSVDVVSRTVAVPVLAHHVEQAAVRTRVIRPSHISMRVAPIRSVSPTSGVPEGVGLTAVDDLALPSPAPVSTSTPELLQSDKTAGFATAAADFGDGLARGSHKAGARTAGFFKRFGKKVAASFGR